MRLGPTFVAGAGVIVLVFLAVSDKDRFAGPVLVELSPSMGVHAGDLLAVSIGVVALAALVLLGRR